MKPPSSVLSELERAREMVLAGRMPEARQLLDTLVGSAQTDAEKLLLDIGRLQLELRANPKLNDAGTLAAAMQALDGAQKLPEQPLIEALALSNLAIVQLRLRIYHAALSGLERGHLLAEKTGDARLAGRLLATRCYVLLQAELYAELVGLAEQLLEHPERFEARSLHHVLNNAAVACTSQVELSNDWNDPQALGASPLWQKGMRWHAQALAHARRENLAFEQLLSSINVMLSAALAGAADMARKHLAELRKPESKPLLDLLDGAEEGCVLVELLLAWQASHTPAAWTALLDFERNLDRSGENMRMVREHALRAISRLGLSAGQPDRAVWASQQLLAQQRQHLQDISNSLGQTLDDALRLQRVLIDNEGLSRQGNELERSLAQRNSELNLALSRVQAEATVRKAAEAALQQANEELELRVQQRTQDLEQALRQILQQEKQLALGRVVVGMAHELNTPLGNARMAASVIRERSEELLQLLQAGQLQKRTLEATTHTLHDCATLLDRAVDSAGSLVQRLKTLSTGTVAEPLSRFDVVGLVRDMLQVRQAMLSERAVDARLEGPQELMLEGYPLALQDVIGELIDNALNHGLDGKRGRLQFSIDRENSLCSLRLQDTGRGIPADDLPKVFDPFFSGQLGRGGAGLGLSVARTLVEELMLGRIEVRSLGHGTCVELRLPCGGA
ncbi:HAMP domain-containing sensor histidine kinase [Pelomonas sp. SE-A7]|uniref:sensor histidine kinase n=1 Tax=Pelomonas sp. SE-A7 TaxID=3054953 RepID=UPI00259CB3EF|nr:HAMP domain-containing sensor histidine kinase [Pelomonas sp. SE-A7]MDM4764926.1 HAMP domain-containing sensor histidine kinase [Pelomonas sp. SE-A7]